MKTNKLITQIFKKWSTKPLQVQDKGLLTICIASYNASKTIANTLSSINLDSNKDVFVYVVDDGSTDNTYDIVKSWIDKYPDQFKYFKKENGNWGSVINFIKPKLETTYFRMLDSDDTFDIDAFEKYVKTLRTIAANEDVDLIISNYSFVNLATNKTQKIKFSRELGNYRVYDLDNKRLKRLITIHSATFNTNIIKKTKPLPEKCFYTDNYLIYQVLALSRNIAFMNKFIFLYNYYISSEEQSINIDKTIKNYNHIKTIYKAIVNYPIDDAISKRRSLILSKLIKSMLYWIAYILSKNDNISKTRKKVELLDKLFYISKLKNNENFESVFDTGYMLIINNFSVNFTMLITKISTGLVKFGFIGATKTKKKKKDKTNSLT